MGLFDRFKKAKMPTEKGLADAGDATQKLLDTDIRDIWDICNRNMFIIAMNGWLSKKCNYGENIATLTAEEKTVYIVLSFEAEANNGGFEQYLFNSSGGAFAGELVASLSAIGANRTADIYKKALENFTCELPADDELRSKLLDELLTDEISKIFASCDRQFYEYLDNLEMLVYQFIINKKVVLNEQKGGSIVEMFPPLLCLLLLRWPTY